MRHLSSKLAGSQQLRAHRALLLRTAIVIAVILGWDLLVRVRMVDGDFLSPPLDVLRAMIDLVGDSDAQEAFSRTGYSIVVAFLIGTSAGLVAALAIGASRTLQEAFIGPIAFILSTPKSIFLPIFTLIFGLGAMSAAAFGAFESFFYVVVNVIGGLGLVEHRHLRVATAFGAKTHHRYLDVVLPAALPGIFAALWYGIKHAFLGVMIAQLWASDGGIGPLIRTYSAALKTDYVLAIVLMITIVAIFAGSLWSRLESRLNRWRASGSATVARVL
jgi:ABC-type nitrate/sulfonate/bicarbonate transport system permease component